MKTIIISFILLIQQFSSLSQNDKKELENLILKDQLLTDSLQLQRSKVDSLISDLITSIESSNKSQRIVDSLNLENEKLKLLLKDYTYQVEKLTIQNNNLKRIERIRSLYSNYPSVTLPYSYKIQGGTPNSISMEEIDTIIFKGDIPMSILGMLLDTSNYFCFIYFIHADDILPAMISYNKNGMLISQKRLSESCWQGCESDCRSILKINEDLTIESDYEEFLFECDDDSFSNIPNEASGYVEYSKIDENGQLTVVKKIIKTKKELAKNPIIHTIEK